MVLYPTRRLKFPQLRPGAVLEVRLAVGEYLLRL
jgi:hypothetical protein